MGQVVVDLSVSLDGFITAPAPSRQAGLGVGGERLHEWLFSGDTPSVANPMFRPIAGSRKVFDDFVRNTGAVIVGRRWFDIVDGWGGQPPLPARYFILTHTVPPGWKDRAAQSPFTFVTDGLTSALEQARGAAGDRDVAVGGANVAQQCLMAGLLDEIQLHVVPVLFGGGTRLFADLGAAPIALQQIAVCHAQDVTHLRFRVVKPAASGRS
jgi:dihydrofolate reductase